MPLHLHTIRTQQALEKLRSRCYFIGALVLAFTFSLNFRTLTPPPALPLLSPTSQRQPATEMGSVEASANEKCALILKGLKDGSLLNATKLDIVGCGLTRLPDEICEMQNLEFLNAGMNPLHDLPPTFAKLAKLRIAFFLGCEFTTVPEVLGSMQSLYMLSFKANKVKEVPEASLPTTLGWLILSDNDIELLPASVGACSGMRKLMLAGNRLRSLPEGMSQMSELELLRIADNDLSTIPDFLFHLPKLAWLAVAANPASDPHAAAAAALSGGSAAISSSGGGGGDVPVIQWEELGVDESAEPMGRGASGSVFKGLLKGTQVAVKVYSNSARTSDGRPEDEMAASILAAKAGHSVVRTLARFQRGQAVGLVMEYLPPDTWQSLGSPPSFETVTRDTYGASVSFTEGEVVAVARDVVNALAKLHASGCAHGDVYAHNVLLRRSSSSSNGDGPAAKLADFGAAFFYEQGSPRGQQYERLEVRAYGAMLEEVAQRVAGGTTNSKVAVALLELSNKCMGPLDARPSFKEAEKAVFRLSAPASPL